MKGGRMRGFMCQPNASTAVCIPGDSHSVVVPRRPDRTLVDHAKIADLRYSRLVDRPKLPYPAAAPPPKPKNLPPTAPPPPPNPVKLTPTAAPPSKTEKILKTIVPMSDSGEKKLELVPLPPKKEGIVDVAHSAPSVDDRVFQVVVMRVSLHCQGCAGKVKKHIAKMEGVTSFSVDLEAKRVTVMGHVSPANVLESVSKVKKAEFWPSYPPAKP